MKWVLATALSLVFLLTTPASAQSGYGPEFDGLYTLVEPKIVTCRVLYEDTGQIIDERTKVNILEFIETCESGAVGFIEVDTDEIDKIAGPPPIPFSAQEGDN